MSSLASFEAPKAKLSYFPLDRRYRYRTSCRDEAKIAAFPQRRLNVRLSLKGLIQALGDHCVSCRDDGVLSRADIDRIMREQGDCSERTCRYWRKRLLESGVLEKRGRTFLLTYYADANRTYAQWQTHAAERKARNNNRQNLRRRAARLAAGGEAQTGNSLPFSASEMPCNASDGQTAGGDGWHLSINAGNSEQPVPSTTRRKHLADMRQLRRKIEAAKNKQPPPSLSPEGVAPSGPTPTPPLTLTFPKQPTPQQQDTAPGASLPIRVAPYSKAENQNQNRGASCSAGAYPDPKAGESKAGTSKPTPRNEAEQWVHDLMARQGIPWVLSAEQGMVRQ